MGISSVSAVPWGSPSPPSPFIPSPRGCSCIRGVYSEGRSAAQAGIQSLSSFCLVDVPSWVPTSSWSIAAMAASSSATRKSSYLPCNSRSSGGSAAEIGEIGGSLRPSCRDLEPLLAVVGRNAYIGSCGAKGKASREGSQLAQPGLSRWRDLVSRRRYRYVRAGSDCGFLLRGRRVYRGSDLSAVPSLRS